MSTLFSRIVIVISFLLIVISAQQVAAQKISISGIVTDSLTRQPLDGAVARILDGNKLVAYDITNSKGEYLIEFNAVDKPLLLNFQHLSYGMKSYTIASKNQTIDVKLTTKDILIREVTVKAPELMVKKDTLSFNVASFQTASDRSIEDVIKRLPGVEVSGSGAIAFQGKPISTFHIEGMNLLGGRYNIATQNIEAQDVNRVEIVENYQEVEQLKGIEYSDNVAMNLKLKEEAKFKLKTTFEAGTGFRGKEVLYHGVITGMIFGKKAQFIGTLKANNSGPKLAGEIINHFGNNTIYNVANNLLEGNLSSQPPLVADRFLQKNDFLATLNSVFKPTDDRSLRINVDYNSIQNHHSYTTSSSYYLNNSLVEINEEHAPESNNELVNTSLEYTINNKAIFLENKSFLSFNSDNYLYDLITNSIPIGQHKTKQLYGLKNDLSILRRNKKRQVDFNSVINYSMLPESQLTFTGVPGVNGAFYQQSGGESFFTKEAVSFGYDLTKISKLSITADFRLDYDNVNTLLQRGDSSLNNQNRGVRMVTSLWPVYRLLKEDQSYGIRIGFPVNMYNLSYKNQLDPEADFEFHRPFFNAWLDAHYTISPSLKMQLYAGYNNSIGDINDFIVHPIQRSYLFQSTRTGILSLTKSQSSQLSLEYKNPIELVFSNIRLGYNRAQRNLLNSQTITTDNASVDISNSTFAEDNSYHSVSASGNISKRFSKIYTTISLNSGYSYAIGLQVRNDIMQEVRSRNFNVSPSINTRIARKIEVDYSMNYSLYAQGTQTYKNTNQQQTHKLKTTYNPIEKWFIFASLNYNRLEITPGQHKNMQFLDAGVRFKQKKVEVDLKLNNLLNTSEYAYTVFSDLDRFSYNYKLNPISAMVICKFTL